MDLKTVGEQYEAYKRVCAAEGSVPVSLVEFSQIERIIAFLKRA